MKDVDRSLTDHRSVQVDIDIKIPPRNLTFSPGLDSFRRYGLDRDVNWKNFVFSSDSAEYSQLSAEDHYQAIVSKLSYGCDLLGLRQRDSLPPRRIPRFQISTRAKNLIKFKNEIHYRWKTERSELGRLIFEQASVSQIQRQQECIDRWRVFYNRTRNKAS